MSLNSSIGLSRKPSQRLLSAVRSIKQKVNRPKGQPKDANSLGTRPLSETILDINFQGGSSTSTTANCRPTCWPMLAPMMFEFEILPRFYRAAPYSSSHQETDTARSVPYGQNVQSTNVNHRNAQEKRNVGVFRVCQVSPTLSRCLPSTPPLGFGKLGDQNKPEQPLPRLFCPPPRCDRTDSLVQPPCSPYRSSEDSSSSQESQESDYASRVSIRLSVEIVQSFFDHTGPSSPCSESSDEELYAEKISARLENLCYDKPLEFIHRRSHAGKGNANKRISSFGVARIIISSPNALQKPLLSPSFKSWLDKFIESRLNQDESLNGFHGSFESMIPEETHSAIQEEVCEEMNPVPVLKANHDTRNSLDAL
ncbi:hypothetical protein PGTUg99_002167 [Puccinia graminis f. sp. tritici]|uniref:Uncharacterized protein n=2 Tax=Puccinia graminis f. sp. tritici TaxID=56615 RepID=E3JZM8_PUCGT|nr:uncharacterized protein PGTG_03459 [Puccinia graminis f. sp. tritici CRL 75-36-700-3]EFP77503.1 hypothetical protein PGTG_03459 [Puccinia graminis f. sp. tritici CRL 75-36-700-3]KAA1064180.1 hypothetical protein PGTUg99_002167 [Puccinia graminis f. sp. tritici]